MQMLNKYHYTRLANLETEADPKVGAMRSPCPHQIVMLVENGTHWDGIMGQGASSETAPDQ